MASYARYRGFNPHDTLAGDGTELTEHILARPMHTSSRRRQKADSHPNKEAVIAKTGD